jgi:hypothetical protein
MEEGSQPVVIDGSDSAELDKFQRQRDRALHQIQCFAFNFKQGNFDLRAFNFANKNKAMERNRRFERLNSACCLFVAREATRRKEQASKAKQRRV